MHLLRLGRPAPPPEPEQRVDQDRFNKDKDECPQPDEDVEEMRDVTIELGEPRKNRVRILCGARCSADRE
jgi:hypothetical protein